jgi:hypothetical protein
MKKIAFVIGLICILLGGLWLLQGLGVVHIRPILCFADCEPIQGASRAWVITGLLLATAGAIAIFFSLKPRAQH